MDYRIKITDGFDGVYENNEGAWLGEVNDDKVDPSTDNDGDFIPAPPNWHELIVERL